MSQQKVRQKTLPAFLCLFFYWGSKRIGEDGSSSLCQLIQMLISSHKTLACTPKNNVLSAIWASLSPVKYS